MFVIIFLLSIILLVVAVLGLGIGVFFSRKKKFPNTSVGGNKALSKKGIYCPKKEQAIIDKNYKRKRINTDCASCNF